MDIWMICFRDCDEQSESRQDNSVTRPEAQRSLQCHKHREEPCASLTTWIFTCQQYRKQLRMMADSSVIAWTALKWLVVCLLVALIVFHQTIYASARTLSKTDLQPTDDKPIMDSRADRIHEIYHVVFLLQQKLVRDVIPAIIDYAELYECMTSETRFQPLLRISERQAPKQLLVCEVPKPLARVLRPVRAIVFTINSHDQGFASDRDGGSWTWFTAQKLAQPVGDGQTSVDDISTPSSLNEHREIIRNLMARSRFTTHQVVWRADAEDPAEAEWVSSMQAGDQFAVHAWARFPAWVNHISDVSVKVYTVAVA
jgi:hypothetical protein